jgi:hypothetical protein
MFSAFMKKGKTRPTDFNSKKGVYMRRQNCPLMLLYNMSVFSPSKNRECIFPSPQYKLILYRLNPKTYMYIICGFDFKLSVKDNMDVFIGIRGVIDMRIDHGVIDMNALPQVNGRNLRRNRFKR